MRIDKYLWYARIFKTRTLATKACQSNKVLVNQHKVKPSHQIKPRDLLSIRYSEFCKTFTVLDLPLSRQSAQKNKTFIQETTPENLFRKIIEKQKTNKTQRSNSKGRPTKKDRRTIDQVVKQMS